MEPLILEHLSCKYPIRLHICSYLDNGNLGIDMEAFIDGIWEDWHMLTINVTPRFGPDFALIDTNNNGVEIYSGLLRTAWVFRLSGRSAAAFAFIPSLCFLKKSCRRLAKRNMKHIYYGIGISSTPQIGVTYNRRPFK